MMALLISIAMVLLPVGDGARPHPDGAAVRVNFSRYDRRPTDDTLRYRIEAGEINPYWRAWYDGLIALPDCSRIGDEFWAELAGRWRRLLVFDCAGHRETVRWMANGDIAGELGWYTAQSIGFTHRGVVPGRIIVHD